MSPWRRIGMIVGWATAVCGVVYVVFVAFLYLTADDSFGDSSDGLDQAGPVVFWLLVASPFIGGLVGLVRTVRGESTRTKVVWSLISLPVMAATWYGLAALAILILDLLPWPG